MDLARLTGADIERPLGIDANGELPITCRRHRGTGACESEYGEAFAHFLTQVPTRTGIEARAGLARPDSAWCRINHFALEKMIRISAQEPQLSDEGPTP